MKESTLDNIADGAAMELFNHELKKIAANIKDPNTGATVTRKVTLTFEFKPNDTRDEVGCHVSAKTALAPIRGYSKTVYAGTRNGAPTLYSADTKQTDMFDQGTTPLKSKAAVNANA